jgi:hypothetical protein
MPLGGALTRNTFPQGEGMDRNTSFKGNTGRTGKAG